MEMGVIEPDAGPSVTVFAPGDRITGALGALGKANGNGNGAKVAKPEVAEPVAGD